MKRYNELMNLRDRLHKEIVQLATRSAAMADNAHVLLDHPLEAAYITRGRDQLIQVPVEIQGIDGTLGELLAVAADGSEKKLYYNDMTLEQMAMLLDYLETSKFTVNELVPC